MGREVAKERRVGLHVMNNKSYDYPLVGGFSVSASDRILAASIATHLHLAFYYCNSVICITDYLKLCSPNTRQRRMRVKNIGGGGAEYHVAVRRRQGGGCGKGDVPPPTKSMKKILLAYT